MLLPRMATPLVAKMTTPLVTLYFVRHGETTGNRDGVLQGHQDYDLTTLGGRQAAVTADRLRNVNFWQTHSSDLVRARRTAEIILADGHTDEPDLRTSPLLREFSLGVLEDLPRGTSRWDARRIKAERAGVPMEDFQEPRAETANDVRERGQQFLEALLEEAREARARSSSNCDTGKDIRTGGATERHSTSVASASSPIAHLSSEEMRALIVSHGGFLYEMLANVLGLGKKVGLPSNCSVSIVDVYEASVREKGGQEMRRASFVPRVINDFAHMVDAGLATANRVENLDVDEK